jgi:phthalate 4,5-dioxygenase oxygenase subunit
MYGAFRPAAHPGEVYWRISHFMFPFWTVVPEGDFSNHIFARAWVPMDDTHTMFVLLAWKKNTAAPRERKDGTPVPGTSFELDLMPNSSDWYGRWRTVSNASNDYLIDRGIQQTKTYSGISGLYAQDQAMVESMGPIVDHSLEHLAISDRMIVVTRRRIAEAAGALRDNGIVPPGADDPRVYLGARGGDFFSPRRA